MKKIKLSSMNKNEDIIDDLLTKEKRMGKKKKYKNVHHHHGQRHDYIESNLRALVG
jgi:hypothetical protein